MKIKTSELIGSALDWAVGVATGHELSLYGVDPSIRARVPGLGVQAPWRPSTKWFQGGPIMDAANIDTHCPRPAWPHWKAYIPTWPHGMMETHEQYGPTRLIAAMRCFVASKMGDEIEIPEELL